MIKGPMQAHVSAIIKDLKEQFKEEMREIREVIKKINTALVQVTDLEVKAQHSPTKKKEYTPGGDLWFFLRDHEENMRK